jgi:DUF1365 family protein
MHSALYSGTVQHRRLHPKTHTFRYTIGMLWLDLAEQSLLFSQTKWVSAKRFAPLSFRETDYLPHLTRKGMPLIDAVRLSLAELGEPHIARVCVLTQARSWGLSFNPISIFYAYNEQNELIGMLCEVSNTPWRERYHYVLPAQNTAANAFRVAKSFHVSPFLPRDLEHRMRFYQKNQRLTLYMADFKHDLKVFDASLNLKRTEISPQSLRRHIATFPFMTAKTVLGIYWQALRLALKGMPFFSHQPADGTSKTAKRTPS